LRGRYGADPARIARIYERAGIGEGEKFFLVSLRSDHNLDGTSDGHLGEEFEDRMINLCRAVRERYGLKPVVVPMQNQFDLEICRRVAKESGGVTVEDLTARELSGLVAGSELVIGMRLHLIVYAAVNGTPPVAISYDPKITSMMEYLDQHHLVNVFEASTETVMPMVEDILQNQESCRAHLRARAATLRDLAARDVKTATNLLQ
jgi:polysaccharide pyruvyl transferase WcaK-like protein